MSKHNWADLNVPNKEFMLLAPHMYRCFRELGAEFIEALFPKFDKIQFELIKERWDNMIRTSREVIEGRIPDENAKRMILYTLPHVVTLRTDLQTGLIKLLYGESVDVSAVMVDDFNMQVVTVMNGHCEAGIPVDWFNIGMEDEIMERRHLKRGMKFNEVYQKTKNITKTAQYLMEVLKDVRNERTPQWSHAQYTIVMLHTSGLFNFFTEMSNYESLTTIWDGFNSKSKYKLPDWWFLFYPDPPLIKTLAMSGRSGFCRKLVNLCTGGSFILQTIENKALNWIKDDLPEAYKAVLLDDWADGIPLPKATLKSRVPLGMDELVRDDGELNRFYPAGTRIKMEDMGFTEEDAFDGYFTDINGETPLDATVSRENLITQGYGRQAKFLK